MPVKGDLRRLPAFVTLLLSLDPPISGAEEKSEASEALIFVRAAVKMGRAARATPTTVRFVLA